MENEIPPSAAMTQYHLHIIYSLIFFAILKIHVIFDPNLIWIYYGKGKEIIVQESLEELQKYLRRTSCPTIKKRIKMLIVIKKRAPEMLSKNELAKLCKCNHNSINSWRRLYLNGGNFTTVFMVMLLWFVLSNPIRCSCSRTSWCFLRG